MKAFTCTRYGPPEVLKLIEIEKPVPQNNEILIKIHATTVTAADFRIRSFTVPRSLRFFIRLVLGIRRPRKPILGVELAGKVEATGKDVTRFRKGDSVFAATLVDFGAYAEYKCLPEKGALAHKPSPISYGEAAALPIGARTALHYFRKIDLHRGQKILIYGASGSVGTYALQLAKHFGARVTAVCSTTNLALVKSLGADRVIDYTKEDFSQDTERYDVVFETVNKTSFTDCLKLLKKGGHYLNIAKPLPNLSMIYATMRGRVKVLLGENSAETADDLIFIKELVEAGTLKVAVDKSYPFEQMVEAHTYVDKGHKKGNVIITLVP